MKIRRYVAKNAQEAMLKVKMDLGSEAVILNTRKVKKKGLFGFFSKPLLEVLAAVDDYPPKRDTAEDNRNSKIKENGAESKIKYDEKEEKIAVLENKVNNIHSLIQLMYEQMLQTRQKAEDPFETSGGRSIDKIIQAFRSSLVKNEVEEEIVDNIINEITRKIQEKAGVSEAAAAFYSTVSGMLGVPETIKLRKDGKPTVILFIGPTGVGKTTTLAKISANFALNQGKKVGLITADTFRVAAVDQLKTYAEILGLPVTVVYSPNEIVEALGAYSDRDMVLIDTAGRSHKDAKQFAELKELVEKTEPDEVYLLLSATTSSRSCREIIKNYCFIKDFKLIFTKADETSLTGMMLNARCMAEKSLSYITTGQSVPDDIEIADIDKITKTLMGSIS